jgi:2-methylisocitrate lyase-like PEP mutase family enzyme
METHPMTATLQSLIKAGETLILPGAYDAMSARMIEDAGFQAYGIGGASVAGTQWALPDAGLLSFGEYRDSVARIQSGSALPVLVDGENGFGDAKATTRTVRTFDALGVGGLALEDLRFPPKLGQPPSVIPIEEMTDKLQAALNARSRSSMMIVGRTDAAHAISLDEAIRRAVRYEQVGVDAVLLTGLKSRSEMARVRDSVKIPIVAVTLEEGPWAILAPHELAALGYEMALYPATLMLRAMTAFREALADLRRGAVTLPQGSLRYSDLSRLVKAGDWARLDASTAASKD